MLNRVVDDAPPEPVLEVEVQVDGEWVPGVLCSLRDLRWGGVALQVEWRPAATGATRTGSFPPGRVRIREDARPPGEACIP